MIILEWYAYQLIWILLSHLLCLNCRNCKGFRQSILSTLPINDSIIFLSHFLSLVSSSKPNIWNWCYHLRWNWNYSKIKQIITFLISLYLFSFDSFFLISPNRLMTKSTEFVEREEQMPISRLPLRFPTWIFHWKPTGDSVFMEEVR